MMIVKYMTKRAHTWYEGLNNKVANNVENTINKMLICCYYYFSFILHTLCRGLTCLYPKLTLTANYMNTVLTTQRYATSGPKLKDRIWSLGSSSFCGGLSWSLEQKLPLTSNSYCSYLWASVLKPQSPMYRIAGLLDLFTTRVNGGTTWSRVFIYYWFRNVTCTMMCTITCIVGIHFTFT